MHWTFVCAVCIVLLASTPGRSELNPPAVIKDAVQRLTQELKHMRNELTDAMKGVYGHAEKFGENAINGMNGTVHAVQEKIGQLRLKYNEAIYDQCFPARPLITFLDHTKDGVETCIKKNVKRIRANVNTVLQEIDDSLDTIIGFPKDFASCRLKILCITKLITRVTVGVPVKVTKIGMAVAETVIRLSTFGQMLLPCTVWEAEFNAWAWDSVTNVTSCISKIRT